MNTRPNSLAILTGVLALSASLMSCSTHTPLSRELAAKKETFPVSNSLEIFKPNKRYSFKIENQGRSGDSQLEIVPGPDGSLVHHVYLPLRIYGAAAFAVVDGKTFHNALIDYYKGRKKPLSANEIEKLKKTHSEDYFSPSARSFSDLPQLKEAILAKYEEVAAFYTTPNMVLHIEPEFFKDEMDIIEKDPIYRDAIQEKIYQLGSKPKFETILKIAELRGNILGEHLKSTSRRGEIFSVNIILYNMAGFFYPTFISVDADTYSMAHEVGHLFQLSMSGNEGYQLMDYPPHGIMNDQLMYNTIKASGDGFSVHVHNAEINSILKFIAENPSLSPKVDSKLSEKVFRPNTSLFKEMIRWPGDGDYFRLSDKEALPILKTKIRLWLDKHPDDKG